MNMEEDKITENMKFENENKTPNEVGVSDEIGIDMLKEQHNSLLAEKDAFESSLTGLHLDLDNYTVQWDIDLELMELELDNFGVKDEHKTFKVQELDRFWELKKEQYKYKVREERARAENHIAGLKQSIENTQERVMIIIEQLEKIESQLKEAGVEIPSSDIKIE